MGKASVAALAAFALAACGMAACGPADRPLPEPPVAATPAVESGAMISFELSVYKLSERDLPVVETATLVLAARCAKRFGVDSTDDGPVDATAGREDNSRRYGIVDADTVDRLGYRSPDDGTPHRDDRKPDHGWKPDAREYLVMTGLGPDGKQPTTMPYDPNGRRLPAGGCRAQAQRDLAGGQPADPALVGRLEHEAATSAERDSRVQADWRAWSGCMAEQGYQYSSPWEPNDKQWGGDTAGPAELATARADVACRRRTNLVGTWLAVERAYQGRLIDANRKALTEVRRRLDQMVQRAGAVR